MTAPGADAQHAPQPALPGEEPPASATEPGSPPTQGSPAAQEDVREEPTAAGVTTRRPDPGVLTRRGDGQRSAAAPAASAPDAAPADAAAADAAAAAAAWSDITRAATVPVIPPWEIEAAAQMHDGRREWRRWPPGWLPSGVQNWLGRIGLVQIICWQVAVALVLLSVERRALAVVTMIGGAVMLVVLSSVRWGGRWMYQWALASLGYLTRRRARSSSEHTPRALLEAVSPGARIESLSIGDLEVGVITHGGGATAVFVPTAWMQPPMVGVWSSPLPTPGLLLPPHEAGGPSVTAQTILRTVPALAAEGETQASHSYWELTANRTPVDQSAWIAVQVQRDVDYLTDEVLRTVLSNVVRRMLRRLRKAGHALDPLPADAVPTVIGTIASWGPPRQRGVLGPTSIDSVDVLTERWTGWQTRGTPHAVLRVHDLHSGDAASGRSLISTLIQAPAAATTVSVASRRRGESIEAEVVADLTGVDTAALQRAVQAGIAAASADGIRLLRLDGYQRAGVAAILPLGGFQPW